MAVAIKNKLYPIADEELEVVNNRFELNHSDRESIAALRGEIDKAIERVEDQKIEMSTALWRGIKENDTPKEIRERYSHIWESAMQIAEEAIQIAAMARKNILSSFGLTESKGGGDA